jgi:hypothetical protein
VKLRHKTTTATIGQTQWNEDHSLPDHALGNLGAAVTIDLANGAVQTGTVNGNVTITLPAVTAGLSEHLTLILTNDATGGYAITVQGDAGVGFAWVGGSAPTLSDVASERNVLVFRGTNGEGWIGDGGTA